MKKFHLLLIFFTLSSNSYSSSIKEFDGDHISKAAYYSHHIYGLAAELYKLKYPVQNLEKQFSLLGENPHVFIGESGGFFGATFKHAVGAVYREDDRIFITFHGSYFYSDWISDLKFTKRSAPQFHNFKGNVHVGFSKVAHSAYDSMVRQIGMALGQDPADQCEFVFCGHSLGGGASTIASRHFSASSGTHTDENGVKQQLLPHGFDKAKIKLITISSPRVGDDEFAQSFSDDISHCLRFHHSADIVEKLPLASFGFAHVGSSIPLLVGEAISSYFSDSETWLEMMSTLSGTAWDIKNKNYKTALGKLAAQAVLTMHKVPKAELLRYVFMYEKVHSDDQDYEGVNYLDQNRSPFMKLINWFVG